MPAAPAAGWLVEVGRGAGIDFLHQDGRSGRRHYPETVASGAGWLDYDGDGDLDLYLLNGAATPGSELTTAPRNALYEQRDGRFVDVTEEAGVGDEGYGMGMCVGDVDRRRPPRCLRHQLRPGPAVPQPGGRPFRRSPRRRRASRVPRWGANCAFADLDGDGDHDLYVANYVEVDLKSPSVPGPGQRSGELLRPGDLRRPAGRPVPQPRRRHFRRGRGGPGYRPGRERPRLRSRDHRPLGGRHTGCVGGQRQHPEPLLRERRPGPFRRPVAPRRSGAQPERPRGVGMGLDVPTWTATDGSISG